MEKFKFEMNSIRCGEIIYIIRQIVYTSKFHRFNQVYAGGGLCQLAHEQKLDALL